MTPHEPSIWPDKQLPTQAQRDHLQNTKDEDLITPFADQVLHVRSNLLIFSACIRANLQENIMHAAMMYVHCFSVNRLQDFNVPLIAASCLSVACQAAEQTVNIEQVYRDIVNCNLQVLCTVQTCSQRLDASHFLTYRSIIIEVLDEMFDMKSPVTATLDVCSKLNVSAGLADASRYIGMITLISSPLCFIYKTEVLACAFINAALRFVPENLTSQCRTPWYKRISPFLTMEFIESITTEVERILYQMCPVVNLFFQAPFMKGFIL